MKFSIITSFNASYPHKLNQLKRCINSVLNQTYIDWEMILIDDGSNLDVNTIVDKLDNRFTYTKLPHNERVVALNRAMELSSGDWIGFLDADDEYFSYTLQIVNEAIEKNKKYKIFNFASYHVHTDWKAHIRSAFEPEKRKVGHEEFGKGFIVNGTFFFNRSIYEKLGAYPGDKNGIIKNIDTSSINYGGVRDLYMGSPWDFSAAMQLELPELQKYCFVDHKAEPYKVIAELGNPWGQDYALFFKYTRKYQTKTYNVPIYIVHNDGKKEGEHHELTY